MGSRRRVFFFRFIKKTKAPTEKREICNASSIERWSAHAGGRLSFDWLASGVSHARWLLPSKFKRRYPAAVRMLARSFGSHGWPLPLGFPLGFWSGQALATGTAWAGLCLIHHQGSQMFKWRIGEEKCDSAVHHRRVSSPCAPQGHSHPPSFALEPSLPTGHGSGAADKWSESAASLDPRDLGSLHVAGYQVL